MSNIVYIVLALGILAAVFFMVVKIKKGGVAGMLSKTLASVFFFLTAVVAFVFNPNCDRIFGILIVAGLVFGLIGDMFLDLKYCYLKEKDTFTFAGMASFALGHICYLTAIYATFYTGNLVTLLVPIAIAVVFACLVVLGAPLLKMDYTKFKVPGLIYAFLLTFMLCSNVAFLIVNAQTASLGFWIVMAVGGFMFIISDLALSQTYFFYKKQTDENGVEHNVLIHENKPAFVIFIHVTYYAAQLLLAMALFMF